MTSKRTQAIVRVLLVLGILVLMNFISVRIFTRLDLTRNHVYTLSDASKALVGSLDDRVTVKAYFTEDLPAPYNNNRRTVLDMLNEYRAYAHGNLEYEFINPEGDKGEEEAQQAGIPPVEVQVVNHDRFEVKRAFLGLVLQYEDRREVLPVVQNLGSLEYDISSALKRLTTRVKKRIGYTTGHQEATLQMMQNAQREIGAQYDLVSVDLSRNEAVPQDLAALLVIAPQSRFTDSAAYAIDQYLMHGGRVAFLLNGMNANLQQRYAQPTDVGLSSLLSAYGVRVNGDLVRDAQCANVSIMQQQGPFQLRSQVPFPYLPAASDFDRGNMIVKDLQSVLFYFVSSLDTSGVAARGLTADVIVRSSKQSGRQAGFVMLDPMARYTPADFAESGIPLAAVISGSFHSAFTGRTPAPVVSQSPETRIIVVGDGDFMKDEYLGSRANLTFFANIVDYLADDAGLITIRSKDVTEPPLEQLSDGTRRLVKYGNLILPPVLVVLYGLVRWRRRVATKKLMEAQIAGK